MRRRESIVCKALVVLKKRTETAKRQTRLVTEHMVRRRTGSCIEVLSDLELQTKSTETEPEKRRDAGFAIPRTFSCES